MRSTSSKAGKFDFGETYPETYPSFLSFYLRREARNTPWNRRQKKTETTREAQSSRFGNVNRKTHQYAAKGDYMLTYHLLPEPEPPVFSIHPWIDAIYGRGIHPWIDHASVRSRVFVRTFVWTRWSSCEGNSSLGHFLVGKAARVEAK